MTVEQKIKLHKRVDKILEKWVEYMEFHDFDANVEGCRNELIKELNLYSIQTLLSDKQREINQLKAKLNELNRTR